MTPTTVKIGYISSLTGVASSTFLDGPSGALARIDAQNAAGGVCGRKIELVKVDDQSTPAGDASGMESLISEDNVFAIINYSSFAFGGYQIAQKAGVPVTGWAFDGPEWGQEPNSNMFSYLPPVSTSWGGDYYYYNWTGKFLQSLGVKKPAGFAYGISPSSISSIKVIYAGAAQTGITTCAPNYSVPFGGVDFTSDVLAVQSAGCDAVVGSFVDSSDEALATAVSQAGLHIKKLWYTGYDSSTLSTAANLQAFNGSYFETTTIFTPSSGPGVATMLNNLAQYDSSFKTGDIPDFGLQGSYVAADLMIKGLEVAGQNPTRQSFISNLRQVTNYNAGGILPGETNFANFGSPAMMPAQGCENFVELVNGQFVNADPGGQPVCAPYVKFSAS